MRFFVFATLLFFMIPSLGLVSQDGKHSTRKKSSTKKKTSKSKSSTQTAKTEIPREEVKFFHENWAMEETEFPSDFGGAKQKKALENPIPAKKETVLPVSKPPLLEPSKTSSIWETLNEYKKVIFISFIILVFALYRIRGGGGGSTSSQDRFFTRLKK